MKVRVYPFEKICVFLRNDAIADYMDSMDKAEVSVTNDIKSAFKFWENARQVSLDPFQNIQDLRISPQALAINDHRLLLEDFMELQPGEDVFCLISKSHPMISSKKSSMFSLFYETIEHERFCPIRLDVQFDWEINCTL